MATNANEVIIDVDLSLDRSSRFDECRSESLDLDIIQDVDEQPRSSAAEILERTRSAFWKRKLNVLINDESDLQSPRTPLIEYVGATNETLEEAKNITVRGRKDLNDILAPFTKSRTLAIDTETTGLDPFISRVRLIQLAVPDHPVVILDLFHLNEEDLSLIRDLIEQREELVLHNAKFDLKFFRQMGWTVDVHVFDTMLAAQVLAGGEKLKGFTLSDLDGDYLKESLPKEEQKSDWSGNLSKNQLEYAARDAEVLLRLKSVLEKELRDAQLEEAASLDFRVIPSVVEMELAGVRLDSDKWKDLRESLLAEKNGLVEILHKELGEINLNSPKQILKALRSKGMRIRSTNQKVLDRRAEEYPPFYDLIKYRKVTKLIQSIEKLPKHVHPQTGRIHPEYRQIGTVTGRFSCSNPNIQQIPRDERFRKCFIPAPGHKLVIADYSQIELRVVAEFSQDLRMITAYQQGEDLHRLTASLILEKPSSEVTKEERQMAKAVNFGLIFAMNPWGLREYAKATYGVEMTEDQARDFHDQFFHVYQGLAKWHWKNKRLDAGEVRTLSGRRRVWWSGANLPELLNSPIQGTAADILKKALGMLPIALKGTEAKIIACVHDEIILEANEDVSQRVVEILKDTMEQAGKFFLKTVPVVVDVSVGDSWAEK